MSDIMIKVQANSIRAANAFIFIGIEAFMSNKKIKEKNFNRDRLYLLPVIFSAGIIPLIMRDFTFKPNLADYEFWPTEWSEYVDRFLAYKSFFIIAVAVLMLVILLFSPNLFKKKEKIKSWQAVKICLLVFAVFVFLSGIVSPNRDMAFGISTDRFESVWVIESYLVIFFYTVTVVRSRDDIDFTLRYTFIFVLIENVILLCQALGADLFRSTFGKILISSPEWWSHLDQVSPSVKGHYMYGTLFNPDYMSAYLAMLTPVAVAACVDAWNQWKNEKAQAVGEAVAGGASHSRKNTRILENASRQRKINLRRLIFWAVNSVVAVLCVILSVRSVNSCVAGLGIACFITILILLSRNKKGEAVSVGIIAVCALTVIFSSVLNLPPKKLAKKILDYKKIYVPKDAKIRNVSTDSDGIYIKLRDGRTVKITYTVDDDGISVDDPGIEGMKISKENDSGTRYIIVHYDGVTLPFYKEPDSGYFYINPAGNVTNFGEPAESIDLFPEGIATGRGYIWNRCLPTLKHTVIFGTGATTFALNYPETDYLHKLYTGWVIYLIPHSFYIQQLYENGWVAAIALFAALAVMLFVAAKTLRKASGRQLILLTGLFTGAAAYLVIGIISDSMVVTAPVFYVLLALLVFEGRKQW